MYVWAQNSVEEIELLQNNGKLPKRKIGYHYDGPFWMIPQDCLRLKFDEIQIPGEFDEKEFKVYKLKKILKNAGLATNGYKKDLQNRCKDNNLLWKEMIPKMEY
eukprot:8767772-Ditylum_brightwellii.AAC.1